MNCAVIFNPTKVSDDFTDLVRARLEPAGYDEPLWLETTAEDPGHAMTAEALAAGVDLVIAAGGDGTVRIVAGDLAGSGTRMGLVPAGTGNLLARNLGLPLQAGAALDVAFAGHTREIDTIEVSVDDGESQRFVVMAGVGLDAMIMDETDPKLKKVIGPAAYFLAAGRAVGRVPVPVQITVDGNRSHKRKAMICLVGNVGQLTGGITLIPQARPDDGFLDVYVASPQRFTHWVKVLLRLVTRRPQKDDHVDLWVGRKVEIRLAREENYQLDGDVEGSGRVLRAEVHPASLVVCVQPS